MIPAPTWIQLLPVEPYVSARDGRKWTYKADKLVDAFERNNGPLAVDYEHGQDLLSNTGTIAPAAGWMEELANRGGELWARIDWTQHASDLISSRAYMFISPSLRVSNGEISKIAGAALVNRPALELPPLVPLRTDKSEAQFSSDVALLASALCSEQEALGHPITTTEAVNRIVSIQSNSPKSNFETSTLGTLKCP